MTIEGRIQEMLVFASVVREGGFTKAARKLGIAKQSVSDRVARLETHLGVRLLERSTRLVRPTEAGAAYFVRCDRIASEIEEANQEVRARQSEPQGHLRISSPYLFGRRFLAPVISRYMKSFPNVRVDLVLEDRRANLIEEGFDLAIRVGKLDDSSLSTRLLGSARISAVASPKLVQRHRLRAPKDLTKVPCIGLRPREEWVWGTDRQSVKPHLVVNDLEIAADAAVADLGVAYLPDLVTGQHLRSGKLVRVFGEVAPVPVFAVFPSRAFLPIKVRAFVDRLLAARLLEMPAH